MTDIFKKLKKTKYNQKQPLNEEQQSSVKRILSWAQQISHHPQYFTYKKQENDDYHFYRIIFQSINQLNIKPSRRNYHIQLSCILFDSQKLAFVNKTYFSQTFQVEPDHSFTKLLLNKSIYFYTANQNIIIKVYIWCLQSQKNNKGNQSVVRRSMIGTFSIQPFNSNQNGSINKPVQDIQIDSLFSPQQSNQSALVQIRDKRCSVNFKLLNTHSLTYLRYFVPSQFLCDQNQRIIGLKDNRISSTGEVKVQERVKLRFQLQNISIPRTIVKQYIEVAQQRIMQTYEIIGKPVSNLKQLILHFEFHNGWKITSKETLILKQQLGQSLLSSKQITESKSNIDFKKKSKQKNQMYQSGNRVYYFEKPKQLNFVSTEIGGALLIWVQSKIQFKFQIKTCEKQKKQKSQLINIPLGFAIKGLEAMQQQRQLKFQLMTGNIYNFQHLLQYISLLKSNSKNEYATKIMCSATICLVMGKGGMQLLGDDTIQKETQQVQSLKAQKQRLTKLRRKLKEQKRKTLIQMNQEIPFLDTINLKQTLYQQKLTIIRSEKLQKEEELFFLKSKITNLEREVLNQYYGNKEDDYIQNLQNEPFTLKKLPVNFIDYKANQQEPTKKTGQILQMFDHSFCKKINKPAKTVDNSSFEQCTTSKTYLNIKIKNIKIYEKEFQNVNLLIQNFQGQIQSVGPFNQIYQQTEYRELNILITKKTEKLTLDILNNMLNGFFPLYLQSCRSNKLLALGLLDIGQLILSVLQQDIYLAQCTQKICFKQQTTLIAEMNVILSLSKNYYHQENSNSKPIGQNNQNNTLTISKISNIKSRIDRFKQANGNVGKVLSDDLIKKAKSYIKSQSQQIFSKRNVSEPVKLKVINHENTVKVLQVHIQDQDFKFTNKNQLDIAHNSKIIDFDSHSPKVFFKTQNILQLQPHSQAFLYLRYLSERYPISSSNLSSTQSEQSLFKQYNHKHTINVTLIHPHSKIIEQIFQITVIPEGDPNRLTVQTYTTKNTNILLPIATSTLQIQADHQIEINPTSVILPVKALGNNCRQTIYLTLYKTVKMGQTKVVFQHIKIQVKGCSGHQVQSRLWERHDLLLKIPIEQIIKKEVALGYSIDKLSANSKHIDLTLRSGIQYEYTSSIGFSRKNNEVYIRAQLHSKTVGQHIYPIEVTDQYKSIIYIIGVTTNISLPNLSPNQIIPILIPNEFLDQPEPFVYPNQTNCDSSFTTHSLRPDLLRIEPQKMQVKHESECRLNLWFQWEKIVHQLHQNGYQECQILIGISNGVIIDYFMFKCREK